MGRRPLSYKLKDTITDIFNKVKEKQKEKRAIKARKAEREAKEKKKIIDEVEALSKEEKLQANINALESIANEITGEDLEFYKKKNKDRKKKYKKWITSDDDGEVNEIQVKKLKKKKRNYNKEFEPELNMLKNLLTEQNKFRTDLLKRFEMAAGPNNKPDSNLNKTIVDLAEAISTAGNAALGTMKEIGVVKKTIAELYIKQRQLEQKFGDIENTNDQSLMGSNIASAIFGQGSIPPQNQFTFQQPTTEPTEVVTQIPISSNFNPDNWNQESLVSDRTKFESTPHKFVVEWYKNKDQYRIKAVDPTTNQEIPNAPVPGFEIKSFDPNKRLARDNFDQAYQLEIIE